MEEYFEKTINEIKRSKRSIKYDFQKKLKCLGSGINIDSDVKRLDNMQEELGLKKPFDDNTKFTGFDDTLSTNDTKKDAMVNIKYVKSSTCVY